ncbi:tRNA 5-methoxyuridine(34)/uridine 5-oxyacetic acid(34) synthase CmoB [Aeromonas schubertii]|uniref:tRNA U34 carboxymethyltransferase n=1 Tax=Aeromonas schubertii TaxID=652 RepID=A0A0S2SPB2_9GAMM|nr:tRNA 5-methoxyuridine(34)/uridine 5-oxyacetic acid(34) synthase CmoB [Aeromonas schubertii]ALP43553.1 tRNA mo(5)U34 methyltransferase [Aeromonas schubertii]
MIDFANFYQLIAKTRLSHWLHTLPAQLHAWRHDNQHGDLPRWERALAKLPRVPATSMDLAHAVSVGDVQSLADGERKKVESLLRQLMPWRKGPFTVHGIHIDTEWRSDWKWERVLPHLSPLAGRHVLDVGCGSGYHLWRMVGEGAKLAVGIDPSPLFLCQFEAIRHFLGGDQRAHLLPLGIQELPPLRAFDTVFSMGVLYHRKSPIEHIEQLRSQLVDGGELVLETLVIDGDEHQVLVPEDRYGKMRNVWFIPSSQALKRWVERCGFIDVRIVDENVTSTDEQRRTDWMINESLGDYLNPANPTLTVEGYPAPKRAVLIARKAKD